MEEKHNMFSIKNLIVALIVALLIDTGLYSFFDIDLNAIAFVILYFITAFFTAFIKYYNSDESKKEWEEELKRRNKN